MNKELYQQINSISQVICEKKGKNILALDLQSSLNAFDAVIIAEGNVNRHAKAIAQALLKAQIKPYKVEGLDTGEWIVLDYVDIMVHIFLPDVRLSYQVETIWENAEIIDLKLSSRDLSDEQI